MSSDKERMRDELAAVIKADMKAALANLSPDQITPHMLGELAKASAATLAPGIKLRVEIDHEHRELVVRRESEGDDQ